MNKILNLNDLGGAPITQAALKHMQDSYVNTITAISKMFGSKVIITGVADNGTQWGDGWIIVDGELLPFVGGVKSSNVIIEMVVQSRQYQDGVTRPFYYTKQARLGITGGFPFTDLIRLDTFANISNALSNLITAHNNLQSAYAVHTHTWSQITGKPTIINPLLVGSFYIGDCLSTDNIKNITFPTNIGTSNYVVAGSLLSVGLNWNDDNDVMWMVRDKTATGFTLLLHEVANIVQSLRFEYILYPL